MKRYLTASAVLLAGILTSAQANIAFQTFFGGAESPPYALGEINGQNTWLYDPGRTDRLQSDRITVNDSSSIGGLNINQRHLFIDANRVGDGSNTRAFRMDRPVNFSIPVGTSNSATYYSFNVAVGDPGTADNSEVFFSISPTINSLFGGTWIAFKASSLANPNNINVIEIGGTGVGSAQFNPAPALAQETFYTLTLGTFQTGGSITSVAGWLNPTLVDGVPTNGADVTLDLSSAPVAPSSLLEIRAQNMPTAITDITIAVPEPSTYAMLAGVCALVLIMVRRRR